LMNLQKPVLMVMIMPQHIMQQLIQLNLIRQFQIAQQMQKLLTQWTIV
jgi:hypothetical protein